MNLVEIKNGWDDKTLGIDLSLGNVCNYKCWYCFPGANEGDQKFPDFETLKTNLTHMLNHYKNNGKDVFDISFVGGEPTHWPKLVDFAKYLKENFNCLLSMTTNGSKKIEYWQQISPYFDRIQMSCHHQYADLEKFREVCDYLYKQNVIVSVSAMMDPKEWDKCIDMVEVLKQSKKRWTIRYVELIGHNITYTVEQTKILQSHRARGPNLFWFWKNNKYYKSKVIATDHQGKQFKMKDNSLLLNRLNNFYGWECNLGVDWLHVSTNGTVSGTCNQFLYNNNNTYNLRNTDFNLTFNPTIQPTICKKISCDCMAETNMPKRVIPIKQYA
jgi:organic radical activating enzyme